MFADFGAVQRDRAVRERRMRSDVHVSSSASMPNTVSPGVPAWHCRRVNTPPSQPVDGEPSETRPGSVHDERLGKVLTTRAIVLAGVLVVIVGAGTLSLLLALFGAGTSADQARLDVFRATGNVVLGAGGAVALLLAARRQRLGELELRRKEQELAQRDRAQEHIERVAADSREHQLRLAEDGRTDAAERRITELYR